MEVEEELTSNRLQESTTTVSNERILEKYTSNDEELGKEASESNTQEEKGEDSSAAASKLDDPTTAVAVTESAEEEVIVQRDNFEVNKYGNSLVVEDSCVLKDEKKDDEGVVKVEIPNDDVAGLERDGSEFINAGIVDGREGEPGVIVRDDGLDLVAEHAKLSGENTNTDGSLVIEDDKDGVVGETETVKAKDDDKVLKDGGVVNVPTSPVSDIGERVEVMTDAIKNDLDDSQKENVEIVPGEETVTEDQDGAQVVNAEVVKEKRIVADEEAAIGVEEGAEEGKLADKEKGEVADDAEREKGGMVGDEKAVVTENDEAEPMVADVEEPLDTEFKSDEEPTMAGEDEVPVETDLPESSIKSSKEKRKRGRKSSQTTPKSVAGRGKMSEEDVCFICFDGGDLVLCDQRNCPKAYHPSCVNRDAAFFQTKGKWNCGWHLCSNCEKKAEYMCYTCTFALCKGCIDANLLLRVREKEKKGFCEACLKTVMLIENKPLEEQGNVDFDDKSSWEYLFKDYWTDTKAKIDLSLSELVEAMNARKESALAGKQELSSAQYALRDDGGSGSENPSENQETKKNKGRMRKRRKSSTKEEELSTGSVGVASEWASKELLEFVMHMGNGDKSFKSQFDVQALLLEYIKTNNLRDPRRKTHIICDARLERLFGKPRVGHFEMLKLLESHFHTNNDYKRDEIQGTVNTEASLIDEDPKDKKRKGRKKGDRRGPQSNRDDYAAIDIHNITMIYLRRKLVEDLLDDMDRFHEKIVGTFVRIRISGANQKQDIYRLVQVTGTSEGTQYTLGKRTTCSKLEILNLDKTEIIPIDTISNQEFMEDECKRLRQSIKCGLISRLTVGDILDKAMELQAARVNDWLETEVVRLNHLRDRASDLGRQKELRECVEKLNILKTPEERARRLEIFPLIHEDPTMDPDYESEDDPDSDDKKQEIYRRFDSHSFNKRGRDQFSPRGDYTPKESWSGTPRSSGKNYEFSRTPINRNFSTKVEDGTSSYDTNTENSRDRNPPIILEKPNFTTNHVPSPRETPVAPVPVPKVNESEKMWHYKDPSGKIQGPFSMIQLRKWNNNGYFPVGLKIWRKSDKEDDGIVLADALEGKFTVDQKKTSQDGQNSNDGSRINPNPAPGPGQPHLKNWNTDENRKPSPDSRIDSANLNLPSPTPNRNTGSWTGAQSPTPNNAALSGSSISILSACGNKDANTGVPTQPPHEPPLNASVSVAQHSTEQGIVVGPQSSLPSQLGQVVAPPDNNIPPQMVQPVNTQNPQGWSNAPPQNMQPNPSMNMAQQPGYNQWPGVPNMVPNPVGNFLPQSVAMPQEPWGQLPFPVVQPNMQQPPLQPQPQPQPQATNVNWPMAPDPNMGWVGPNPQAQMNWMPMMQGPQVAGNVNVNPAWIMQGGPQSGWVPPPPPPVMPNQNWVATPIPGPGNGNPGWVGAPGNQGVAPNGGWGPPPPANQGAGNTNTGWVGGPGNQGGPIPNQGWVPPTGNQGPPPAPGNGNQNWGPRNHGNWGGNERHHNRGGSFRDSGRRNFNRGSGYRGNRRDFNRQESFRGGGSGDSGRLPEQ